LVKEFKPIYLLYGEDALKRRIFIKKFISPLLDKKNLPFNLNIYDSRDIDIQRVIDIASTLSFLSQYRVVIINNVECLKEDQINLLLRYCKNPNLYTCLILSLNKSKVPPEFSDLVPYSKRFNTLSDEELFTWVKNRLKELNASIELEALELIVEYCGNNLAVILKELEKVMTYTGGKSIIEKEDVENVLGRGIQKTAFEFIDLIFKKNTSGALMALGSISTEIEKYPPKLLGLILWNFKQILKIKNLLDNGKEDYEIFQILKINRKTASDFIKQAKEFKLEELKRFFKFLLDLDLNLKRSRISPKTGYELLSVRLLTKEFV